VKHLEVYTDGSSSGNPGPSAWCCIFVDPETKREKMIKGSTIYGTSNQMELQAAVKALQSLKDPHSVTLHTDSAYVYESMKNKAYERWIENDWKTASNNEIRHKELWIALIKLSNKHQVEFIKVKAHSGHQMNNKVDRIAYFESQQIKKDILRHEKKTHFKIPKKK
jgi:ribonuclease HI